MRRPFRALLGIGTVLTLAAAGQLPRLDGASAPDPTAVDPGPSRFLLALHRHIDTPVVGVEEANDVIRQTCLRCHNDRSRRGNLSLADYDAGQAWAAPDVSEAIVRKLRAGMMPPPGSRRPEEAVLQGVAAALEAQLDSVAESRPEPGTRVFQRLNQAEYRNAVHDLLTLEIDAAAYLPSDTKSANFDNIADVQLLSPTLLDAYLKGAAEIARLALGDPHAVPEEATYTVPRLASQWEWVEGAPFGTRGGLSVMHTFPADGDYTFRIRLQPTPTGQLFGRTAREESVEISVDGERVALVPVDRWMSEAVPRGRDVAVAETVHIRAGQRRISATPWPTPRSGWPTESPPSRTSGTWSWPDLSKPPASRTRRAVGGSSPAAPPPPPKRSRAPGRSWRDWPPGPIAAPSGTVTWTT